MAADGQSFALSYSPCQKSEISEHTGNTMCFPVPRRGQPPPRRRHCCCLIGGDDVGQARHTMFVYEVYGYGMASKTFAKQKSVCAFFIITASVDTKKLFLFLNGCYPYSIEKIKYPHY